MGSCVCACAAYLSKSFGWLGQFIGEEGLWLKADWALEAAEAQAIPRRFRPQGRNYIVQLLSLKYLRNQLSPGCKADNLAAFWLDPLDVNFWYMNKRAFCNGDLAIQLNKSNKPNPGS